MALVYVGGKSESFGFSGTSESVSITSLVGGLGGNPQDGDIVVVSFMVPERPATLSVTGYTSLANIDSSDSDPTSMWCGYKIMTSTPDTTLTINTSVEVNKYVAVHVWRGIDAGNPIDATTTTATGINTSVSNPPSITPVTEGAVILAVGAAAYRESLSVTSAPSGYSNLSVSDGDAGAGIKGYSAISSNSWSGSGAEDPGSYSVTPINSRSAWCAATVALRPNLGEEFSISETLALTETTTAIRGRLFTVAETLGLTETVTALKGIGFTISETLNLSETFTTAQTFVFSVAESLGLIELGATVEKKWNNITKSVSSWTNPNKNTSTFTNQTKNDSDWDNTPKS